MKRRRRRGGSEKDQEDLARARRERARRARADLAAKAKADAEASAPKSADAERKAGAGSGVTGETGGKKADAEGKRGEGKKVVAKDKRGERKGDGDDGGKADRKPPKAGRKRTRGKAEKPGRRKRSRRAGAKRAGRGALVALKQGAAETRRRARKAAPRIGHGAGGLLVSAFAIFFAALGLVLRALIAAYKRIAPPIRTGLREARRALEAVSRQVTPVRVLALVVAGAAVLLALSQFADYRTISIGNDAYADGIQTVAPAPVRETDVTGDAHSYLLVPLAAVALVLLGAALTGRWRLCRLIALAGLIAIAVGLLHDRPTGLDPGEEAARYTGVEATLIGGFYAQLFSGLLLTLSALLLGRELRLAAARRPARASRGSRVRRRLLRRNPRVEGARA